MQFPPGTDSFSLLLATPDDGGVPGPYKGFLERGTFEANDGCTIAYDRCGGGAQMDQPVVVLLHGWSGSRRYFDPVLGYLSMNANVYRLDLRGHGESQKTEHGLHVARLAADLQCFLETLQLEDVYLLGTSMGCAVIWSYIELFGENSLRGCVFVDQAPLQYRLPDWDLGSTGCFDQASLKGLQDALADLDSFADGNADACFSQPVDDSEGIKALLKSETLKCDGRLLGLLMADHTQLDWRALLPKIKSPCLNFVGKKSKIFPWEGVAYVGEHIPLCENYIYANAGHWLYIEEPFQFAMDVLHFIRKGWAVPQGLVGTEEDMSDESDSELDGDDGGEGALEPAEVAAAEPAKKKKRAT